MMSKDDFEDALIETWAALELARDELPLTAGNPAAQRDCLVALRHIDRAQKRLARHMDCMKEQVQRER